MFKRYWCTALGVILTINVLTSSAFAQTHFDDCLSRTGNNAHLLIPADAPAVIGEEPVAPGDELAVFTSTGTCAGALVWSSSSAALTIWGDDSFTPAKESFANGDELRFAFWDASAQQEYHSVVITLDDSEPFYRSELSYARDGLYLLKSLAVLVEADAPSPIAPVLAARAVSLDPVLMWQPVTDAVSYEVDLALDPEFESIESSYDDVPSTSLQVTALDEGTTYHWRVRAMNGAGASEYAVAHFTTEFSQPIDLVQGWNLVSGHIQPNETKLPDLFEAIDADLLMVKNGAGEVFSPEFGINTIGDWRADHGYLVYTSAAQELMLRGDRIEPDTPLSLTAGWNTIAYWPDVSLEAPTALSSIADKVVLVKNGIGDVWLPEFGVNTMGPMDPGSGYMVHLTGAAQLTYPAPAGKQGSDQPYAGGEKNGATLGAAIGANATLLIRSDDLADGTTVLVRDVQGTLVGEGQLEGGLALIVVRGDVDLTTDVVEGAVAESPLSVELSAESGRELRWLSVRDLLNGELEEQPVYRENGAWVAEVGMQAEADVPERFELLQNYPNPFNPTTTIEYQLAEGADVRLEVWNMLGQRVRVLVEEAQQAGRYQVAFDAAGLPSGVYVYTIQAGSHRQVKQMVLLK